MGVIDLDCSSKLKLKWALLKGRLLCGKPADEIYRTRRGFHCIWKDLPITWEQSFRYRKIIGDDRNRIYLDKSCPEKPKQVLFDSKKVTRFDKDGNFVSEETFKRKRIR